MKKYLVRVSGGRSSAMALKRTIEKFGKENTVGIFADTKTEDEDLYRFLAELEVALDLKVTRIGDGRNIWELFKDEKFIGNHRFDVCSRVLKRDLIDKWVRDNFEVKPVVVLGYDWSEPHRIESARKRFESDGFETWFPLAEAPYLLDDDHNTWLREIGVEPPRLYEMGFSHNNCGGACVKAGQYQWKLLYQKMPERYLWHEEQERQTREIIGKDVSVLIRTIKGVKTAMTLEEFRLRIVADEKVENDGMACTCIAE